MLTRTVSIIVIFATIACPMWCGNGACIAALFGSSDQSTQNTCSAPCCEHSQNGKHHQSPGDVPIKPSCQGICGGAVFDKPREFKNEWDDFFCPLIDDVFQSERLSIKMFNHTLQSDPVSRSSGNIGLENRLMQMSFLC